MKKIIAILAALSIAHMGYADDVNSTPQVKEVSKASPDNGRAAETRNRWIQVGIAALAVAVAATAIILASTNDGHHGHN